MHLVNVMYSGQSFEISTIYKKISHISRVGLQIPEIKRP